MLIIRWFLFSTGRYHSASAGALSHPNDFRPLNLEKESKSIYESIKSVTNLVIKVLNNPTVEDVQDALNRPQSTYFTLQVRVDSWKNLRMIHWIYRMGLTFM